MYSCNVGQVVRILDENLSCIIHMIIYSECILFEVRQNFLDKYNKTPEPSTPPSFLGVAAVLSYFFTRTSSRQKYADTTPMPSAFLLVSGDKHKKQRTIILQPLKHCIIKIYLSCKDKNCSIFLHSVLIVSYKRLISFVFYVYLPMSFCRFSSKNTT